MIFDNQLNRMIKRNNLTIADAIKTTGISKTSIYRYLSGERAPNFRDACWIANTLGYEIVFKKKETKNENDDMRKNGSGYFDSTAYQAIKHIEKERARFSRVLKTIFDVCDLADFHVEGHIELKDKRTGKIWK